MQAQINTYSPVSLQIISSSAFLGESVLTKAALRVESWSSFARTTVTKTGFLSISISFGLWIGLEMGGMVSDSSISSLMAMVVAMQQDMIVLDEKLARK